MRIHIRAPTVGGFSRILEISVAQRRDVRPGAGALAAPGAQRGRDRRQKIRSPSCRFNRLGAGPGRPARSLGVSRPKFRPSARTHALPAAGNAQPRGPSQGGGAHLSGLVDAPAPAAGSSRDMRTRPRWAPPPAPRPAIGARFLAPKFILFSRP